MRPIMLICGLVLFQANGSASIDHEARAVLVYRKGLADAVLYLEKLEADLDQEQQMLSKTHRDDIARVWSRFEDYIFALDSMIGQTDTQPNRAAFLIQYSGYLAQYRFALDFLKILDPHDGIDVLLDDPSPLNGWQAGRYADFKFRFLNLAAAAQFARMNLAYEQSDIVVSPELEAVIKADREAIWQTGLGKGELMTLKNGLKIIKGVGKRSVIPVQTGIAGLMGDIRVRRSGQALIKPDQVQAMVGKLRPGDILVERREWFMSNIGIPGFWTHAALYVGTPEERDLLFDDAEVRAWVGSVSNTCREFNEILALKAPRVAEMAGNLDADGHPYRILEAIAEGVVLTSLEHTAFADSVGVMRPELEKVDLARALLRAFQYHGRPYDYDFDFRTDSALVCSELVFKSYEGMLQFPLQDVMGRPLSSPNEMVRTFGGESSGLSMVLFLDGSEKRDRAFLNTEEAFKQSWKRPKWHIIVEDGRQ